MNLTQAEIDRFQRDGFLPILDVLTADEVRTLHGRLEDIGNEATEFPQEYVQLEPRVASGEVAADPVRFNNVRKIWNLTTHDELFREYARHPRLVAMATSILGPDVKVFLDQTLCKPASVGSAKPPHQDSAYWTEIEPPDLVICWMALTDATEGNGCMCYFPGSHKGGVIEHKFLEDFRVEDELVDYSTEVIVPLKAGSCCLHHSLCLHRTGPNTSDQRRIGLTVAYMSARSKFVGGGEKSEFQLVAGRDHAGCV